MLMTDVQALLRKLIDPKESAAAYKALYEIAPTIVDPLLNAFNDSNVAIRMQVANLLGNSGDPRVVDALMTACRDSEQRVRTSALAALGKFENNGRVVDFLRQMARSNGEMNERTGAVFALARAAGKPAAAELWLEMLNDSSPQIVGNAASQLGMLKLSEAVEPLAAILNRDGEKSSAFMLILLALGDIGDPRAFDAITPYLKSSDPHKRTVAASALGRLGDPRGIALLEPMLKDKAVAGQEDHGGPSYTVADTVRAALESIRKKNGTAAPKAEEPKPTKPRWKFW
jgi:HEAT repeat protein